MAEITFDGEKVEGIGAWLITGYILAGMAVGASWPLWIAMVVWGWAR